MRTWSCAPARSRTLSVLNLRPSERYASAALSSIPISLRRNDSRLPSLMKKGVCSAQLSPALGTKVGGLRVCPTSLTFQCPKELHSSALTWVSGCPRHRLSKKGIPGILHRLQLYIFESWLFVLMREMRNGGWLRAARSEPRAVTSMPPLVCVPLKRKTDAGR